MIHARSYIVCLAVVLGISRSARLCWSLLIASRATRASGSFEPLVSAGRQQFVDLFRRRESRPTWFMSQPLRAATSRRDPYKGGNLMPGKSAHVKNEKQYEALKEKGMSKERAAKIPNSPAASTWWREVAFFDLQVDVQARRNHSAEKGRPPDVRAETQPHASTRRLVGRAGCVVASRPRTRLCSGTSRIRERSHTCFSWFEDRRTWKTESDVNRDPHRCFVTFAAPVDGLARSG